MKKSEPLAFLRSPAGRAAFGGVFLAAALILGYVEVLIPLPVGIPGVKLGLPNLAVLIALYSIGPLWASAVSLCRVLLSALLFSNIPALVFSVSGAVISLAVMILLSRSRSLSVIGVSAVGGVAHNLAQLVAAALFLGTPGVMYYLPPLIISGSLFGAVLGIAAGIIISKLNTHKMK